MALAEQIGMAVAQMAREDVKKKIVPLYSKANERKRLYQRLNKMVALPAPTNFFLETLRALYTSFYIIIYVNQDL